MVKSTSNGYRLVNMLTKPTLCVAVNRHDVKMTGYAMNVTADCTLCAYLDKIL